VAANEEEVEAAVREADVVAATAQVTPAVLPRRTAEEEAVEGSMEAAAVTRRRRMALPLVEELTAHSMAAVPIPRHG
jgi:hypothetical protein